MELFEAAMKFRRRLAEQPPCIGASITLSDPVVTEAIGELVDFVWIDLEHTSLGFETLQSHLIAARATGTPALVRVPTSDVGWIKRVLDTGPDGIIIPQVASAAEARKVVENCRYAPIGNRGFGPRRASGYGEYAGGDYLKRANQGLFVVVQVETAGALADIEEIAAIPHLDSIALGPYDLSLSMGKGGNLSDPDVRNALTRITTVIRGAGKFVGSGMGAGDYEYAAFANSVGVQWLQVGGDVEYLRRGTQGMLAGVRQAIEKSNR